jgi:RHS repeat-associated protein
LPSFAAKKQTLKSQMRLPCPGDNQQLNYGYTYDKVDNITAKQTEHGDYGYQYDNLYRLTDTDNPDQADETFDYDRVGNRIGSASVSGAWTHNANNELEAYGETTFQYDANGNMTQKNVGGTITRFFYNLEDRLERVEDGAGQVVATYYYDPFGRRLWKEVSGTRTYFHYSDEGLVGEYGATGVEIKTYGWKPGSTWSTDPLFMKIGSDYYWYHNDHLGTPQVMTNSSGAVVWKAKYTSFGKAAVDPSSTVVNPLRFPGQYEDAEIGLHYNYHRYYSPNTGRYLKNDPSYSIHIGPIEIPYLVMISIKTPQEYNLYAYVKNSPQNKVDFEGLWSTKSCGSQISQIMTEMIYVENAIRSNCIPNQKLRNCLTIKMSKLKIVCYNNQDPDAYCGWAMPWGHTIHINLGKKCGPKAGTVFHEMIHTCSNGEKKAYGCEEKCFPGSSGGQGNPCDCK